MNKFRWIQKLSPRGTIVTLALSRNQEALLLCCLLGALHVVTNRLDYSRFDYSRFDYNPVPGLVSSTVSDEHAQYGTRDGTRAGHLWKEQKFARGEKIALADIDQFDLEQLSGVGPHIAELIMQNHQELQQACSTEETCLQSLIRLRGIGPVTASRLLESISLKRDASRQAQLEKHSKKKHSKKNHS